MILGQLPNNKTLYEHPVFDKLSLDVYIEVHNFDSTLDHFSFSGGAFIYTFATVLAFLVPEKKSSPKSFRH